MGSYVTNAAKYGDEKPSAAGTSWQLSGSSVEQLMATFKLPEVFKYRQSTVGKNKAALRGAWVGWGVPTGNGEGG